MTGTIDHFGLNQLNAETLKDKYVQPHADAVKLEKGLNTKIDALSKATTNEGKATAVLKQGVVDAEAGLARATKSRSKDVAAKSELVDKARAAVGEARDKFRDFLSGKEVEVNITKGNAKTATATKVTASKPLQETFTKTEAAATKVTGPASSHFGIVRTQKDGWATAVKKNWAEVKEFKPGTRGMAVARSGVVVGSAIAMGDALFRGKDSNGEDRSAATRLAEFVIAGGVGTAAAVSGRAFAR